MDLLAGSVVNQISHSDSSVRMKLLGCFRLLYTASEIIVSKLYFSGASHTL